MALVCPCLLSSLCVLTQAYGAQPDPSPQPSYTQAPPHNAFLDFSSTILSLHAGLSLPASARSTIVIKLIAAARRMLNNLEQCALFAAAAQAAIALVVLIAAACGLPNPLSPASVLWVAWIQAPLLALPLLTSPAEAALMTENRTPGKNSYVLAVNEARGQVQAANLTEGGPAAEVEAAAQARAEAAARAGMSQDLDHHNQQTQVPSATTGADDAGVDAIMSQSGGVAVSTLDRVDDGGMGVSAGAHAGEGAGITVGFGDHVSAGTGAGAGASTGGAGAGAGESTSGGGAHDGGPGGSIVSEKTRQGADADGGGLTAAAGSMGSLVLAPGASAASHGGRRGSHPLPGTRRGSDLSEVPYVVHVDTAFVDTPHDTGGGTNTREGVGVGEAAGSRAHGAEGGDDDDTGVSTAAASEGTPALGPLPAHAMWRAAAEVGVSESLGASDIWHATRVRQWTGMMPPPPSTLYAVNGLKVPLHQARTRSPLLPPSTAWVTPTFLHFMLRMFPTAAVTVGCYAAVLYHNDDSKYVGRGQWNEPLDDLDDVAKAVALLVFVFSMVPTSATMMYRTTKLSVDVPTANRAWVVAAIVSIVLQVCIMLCCVST